MPASLAGVSSGVSASPGQLGGLTVRTRPAFGLRPTLRFALAATATVAYVASAVSFSAPWRAELEAAIGPVMGWVIPILLAYVPGLLIGFLAFTLILTRYQPPVLEAPDGPWPSGEWPAVTVIVAAYNEQDAIVPTLERIAASTYDGPLQVVLADNNCADRTAELAGVAAHRLGLDYRRVFEPVAGKYRALNTALAGVTTPLVVTVDADTLVYPEALMYLIARIASRPQDQHVCACAGALVAENATQNFLTRMQSWDYRLGINGVKRMQASYNSALVAQGAFSAYWASDVRAVGGWPDAIGEDIVLTWRLMGSRGVVQYEPIALSATVVPDRLRHLMSQRSRWARGMLEGIRINPPRHEPRVLAKFVCRDRLSRPVARHRLRVLLGTGRDPVHLRLSAAVLVVVDARDPHHARHLRAAATVAGPQRVQAAGRPARARPARVLRLPARLPGPDLHRVAARIRPGADRRQSPVEVAEADLAAVAGAVSG